jgi:hypothetical protein
MPCGIKNSPVAIRISGHEKASIVSETPVGAGSAKKMTY